MPQFPPNDPARYAGIRKPRLLVIGGGAAGIFCAVNAARLQENLEVILLEKSGKLLSKVKVSGGGRCNLTHSCFDIGQMARNYPRGENFVKKSFHRFFSTDTIKWFEERGVHTKTEADGRMFPVTDSSQTVMDCLVREASRYRVVIRYHAEARKISRNQTGFQLQLASGETISSDFVCVAAGGYSKASMFEWLSGLGHTIIPPVPSLFTFNMPGHPITALMGVSVLGARVKIEGTRLQQEGPLLITHWGLSGPAILRLSAWGARELQQAAYTFRLRVNWIPGYREQELASSFPSLRKEKAAQRMDSRNPFGLPQRLWEFLLAEAGILPEKRWADLTAKEQSKLLQQLCHSIFEIRGKTTFREEFVTAGGISTLEVDPATMMSRKTANLFFAGEILDVDGITGGFNFQHAWTSGFIAASTIAEKAGAWGR